MAAVQETAYCVAFVRLLEGANIKFVRYLGLDVCGTIRCKAVTVEQIKRSMSLNHHVSIVRVCIGGMPSYGDVPQSSSGFSAKDCDMLEPDLSSFRILPYAKNSAVLLGNFVNPRTKLRSDICCRSLLEKVVAEAVEKHKVRFNVGAEIEFNLFNKSTGEPIDYSTFGNTISLNAQGDFISELYDMLVSQEITVEQVHSESAPGQIEVVLRYTDPVTLCDTVVLARETISSVAQKYGLMAVFLPKVFNNQAGNGLHLHISAESIEPATVAVDPAISTGSGATLDAINGYCIEGILQHVGSLMALTMPSANSFRRMGNGCWTGATVTWGFDDKEQPIRAIYNPVINQWDHFEFKLVDNSANIYSALSGILMASIDGVERKTPLRACSEGQDLPSSPADCFNILETDPLFTTRMPASLLRGILSARRADAVHTDKMSLEDQVRETLRCS